MGRRSPDARCSFCGKKQDQVQRLIAGPGVFICDNCVALCNEIIQEQPPTHPGAASTRDSAWKRIARGPNLLGRWFRTQELQPAQR